MSADVVQFPVRPALLAVRAISADRHARLLAGTVFATEEEMAAIIEREMTAKPECEKPEVVQ